MAEMPRQTYLITTQSYRRAATGEEEVGTPFGLLVETDFQGFQRTLRIETPTDSPHGERIKTGVRGLAVHGGRIITSSWNTIFEIDPERLEVTDSWSHPLMSDLHGIHVDDQGLWAASTLIDAALCFDPARNLAGVVTTSDTGLYPRRARRVIDLDADYRLRGKRWSGFLRFHVNHVTVLDERHVLVTGRGYKNRNGRVLKVDRESMEFTVWAKGLLGPHDGLFVAPNLFAVTETETHQVALVDASRRRPKVIRRLDLPPVEGRMWTRGICKGPDDTLFVGRSTWKGDNRRARVAHIGLDGRFIGEHELDLGDYPGPRIFQITPAPLRGAN